MPARGLVRVNLLEAGRANLQPCRMTKHSPFRYFKTSPEVIRLAVMMCVRLPLSLCNVEDLLHERGVDVSHETARFWWNRFGPMFASHHLHQPFSPQSSDISPASTSRRSSCFSSPRTRRPTFDAWRWAASLSFVCRPCLILASEMRCKPSGVRAPVDRPPWSLQRPLCL